MNMVELLPLIERYGLSLILLLVFMFLYIRSNKDKVNLIIKLTDENNNKTVKHIEAIYLLNKNVDDQANKIISELKDEIDKVNDTFGDRLSRIEMILTVRSEEK